MKILSSISYYTPYVSGLTLHVKRLSEALVAQGHLVTVLTNRHLRDLSSEDTLHGVQVIRASPLVKLSKGFVSWDFIAKSFHLVQKADVIHLNLPQFEGVIPALFGKLFGKRVVATYHCEVVLPAGFVNRIIELLLTLSNLTTLLLSDRVVTYTKDFADHCRLLRFVSKKTTYIYPPISVSKINKRVQNIIRKKIDKADVVIGVAARLSAEKGIEYLFEALPQIKSKIQLSKSKKTKTPLGWPEYEDSPGVEESRIKIVIAGSLDPVGEKSYKEKILKLVKKYQENIVFLGELKEEEMGSFYSLLDVLVLPSINSTEAFGMVQVEAMMMGVPVVASDLPGVRVPVRRTKMGLIVPCRDARQLARAIKSIVKNKKNFIKPKSNIEKEFNPANTLTMYQKIFEDSR